MDFDLLDMAIVEILVYFFEMNVWQILLSKGEGDFEFWLEDVIYKLIINGQIQVLGLVAFCYQYFFLGFNIGIVIVSYYFDGEFQGDILFVNFSGDWIGSFWQFVV